MRRLQRLGRILAETRLLLQLRRRRQVRKRRGRRRGRRGGRRTRGRRCRRTERRGKPRALVVLLVLLPREPWRCPPLRAERQRQEPRLLGGRSAAGGTKALVAQDVVQTLGEYLRTKKRNSGRRESSLRRAPADFTAGGVEHAQAPLNGWRDNSLPEYSFVLPMMEVTTHHLLGLPGFVRSRRRRSGLLETGLLLLLLRVSRGRGFARGGLLSPRPFPLLRRQRDPFPRRAVLRLLRHPLQQAHNLDVVLVERGLRLRLNGLLFGGGVGGGRVGRAGGVGGARPLLPLFPSCGVVASRGGGGSGGGCVRVGTPAVPFLPLPFCRDRVVVGSRVVRGDLAGARCRRLLLLTLPLLKGAATAAAAANESGGAGPRERTARHGGGGRARRRRSWVLVVDGGAVRGGYIVVVAAAAAVEVGRGRRGAGAGAGGRRGDRDGDAGGRGLGRSADGEEGRALAAAEVGVLVGAALAAFSDLAEAVQVELALEAGELVLLEEAAQHFGAQSGVVADLRFVRGYGMGCRRWSE